MQTLELFAGCGGLAKGLELAGFKHVGLLEINHQACESLRVNFNPRKVVETDVSTVDFRQYGTVDMVSGGPPCQPFSLGGNAQAYKDKRDMFPQAIRAITEVRPKVFLFENVKGLLRQKFSPYFTYIILRLSYPDCGPMEDESWLDHLNRLQKIVQGDQYQGLRYRVQYRLLNAADYGIPQVRERVFIIGIRSDLGVTWTWPAPICPTKESRMSIASALRDVPDPRAKDNPFPDHVFIDGARVYPGHTGSDVNLPSKTVKAGAHGVPGGENMLRFNDGTVRYMTIYEAKLLQTFPSDFVITGSWGEALRQIGNAVPVQLAEMIGRRLFRLLKQARQGRAHSPIMTNDSLPDESACLEQMAFSFDESSAYFVRKSPLTLFATYPRANREWIMENGLYNYPLTPQQMDDLGQLQRIKRLILQNRQEEPLYFSVIGHKVVTRKELQAYNYPRRGHHAHYLLFVLSANNRPILNMKESDFNVLVGVGRTYRQFVEYFNLNSCAENQDDREGQRLRCPPTKVIGHKA